MVSAMEKLILWCELLLYNNIFDDAVEKLSQHFKSNHYLFELRDVNRNNLLHMVFRNRNPHLHHKTAELLIKCGVSINEQNDRG